MRNLIIAVCCAALFGSVSMASAQTATPPAQDATKSDSPAKMKKKSAKKSAKTTKSGDSAPTSTDDTKK